MFLLHRIGPRVNSNFNTLEEIRKTLGPISFDGIYQEVFDHAGYLYGREITLFPSGNHMGEDNAFDVGQPPGRFIDLNQLRKIQLFLNADMGWHSWSHRDLTTLTDDEIVAEITPPEGWPFPRAKIFAYPYGRCDDRVIEHIRAAGYDEAFCAGHLGDGSRFQRRRPYLNW